MIQVGSKRVKRGEVLKQAEKAAPFYPFDPRSYGTGFRFFGCEGRDSLAEFLIYFNY